jgi:predicted transcriptional regulator
MTKSLMISIQPKHLVNILKGYKTLELRKTVPKDYKGWVYIYCTKGKYYLGKNHDGNIGLYNIPAFGHYNKGGDLNGKVVARFWFDEYIKLDYEETYSDEFYWRNSIISGKELEKATCLLQYDIVDYGKGKDLYAWHIKKLEVFDEPKELSDFIVGLNYLGDIIPPTYKKLKKAPQSYQYVYTKEKENDKQRKNRKSVGISK